MVDYLLLVEGGWPQPSLNAIKQEDYKVDFWTVLVGRFGIWLGAILVSLIPPLHIGGVDFTFDIPSMVVKIFHSNGYSHFFFITIVMAVLGISNIYDNIFISPIPPPTWIRTVTTLGMFIFSFAILMSLPRYFHVSEGVTKDNSYLATDLEIMGIVLVTGIIIEVCIACFHVYEPPTPVYLEYDQFPDQTDPFREEYNRQQQQKPIAEDALDKDI